MKTISKIIKYCLLVAVIGCCITGCKNSQNDTANVPVIAVDIKAESCDASDIFESYEYVILESSEDSFIGAIQRIDINDKYIAINFLNDIFIFHRDGRFKSKISRFGQGPEEYIYMSDLKLMNDEVLVLCSDNHKIYRYTTTGDFIGTYNVGERYHFMLVDGDFIWLASVTCNDSMKEFAQFDTKTETIACTVMDFETRQSFIDSTSPPFLHKNNNKLLVTTPFNHTVYNIDTKTCSYSEVWTYKFNTEKQISDFSNDYYDLYMASKENDFINSLGRLYESGETVYQYIETQVIPQVYAPTIYSFDKRAPENSGKLLKIGLTQYDDFPFLKSKPLTFYKQYYVSRTYPDDILTIEEKLGSSEFKDKGLTEESNPVLFFYKFK